MNHRTVLIPDGELFVIRFPWSRLCTNDPFILAMSLLKQNVFFNLLNTKRLLNGILRSKVTVFQW